MPTRLILVDDHKVIREGLQSLFEQEPGMSVVGQATDGRSAVELARRLAPDVAVMDVAMPDLNGIEAARQIADTCPHTRVVALSMHADRRFVGEMLRAGAMAYLLKTCEFDELLHAIRCVLSGRRYLTPDVTSTLVDDYLDQVPAEVTQPASPLSPKEREVLQLLTEGMGAKEIALHLDVSVKTIHTHRQHIMDKLNAHSLAELTKYAIREGITSL